MDIYSPILTLLAVLILSGVLLYRWFRKRAKSPIRSTPDLPATTSATGHPRMKSGRAATSEGYIFLSYASSNRPTARAMAEALSALGWSVWWDRTILPGKTYDQVIETALNSAKCVVVLWSKESVSSDWVKTEASEGARRHILVPALIEDVAIPLEFRRIQAASLVDWDLTTSHPGFESLARSVSDLFTPLNAGEEARQEQP